MDIFRDENEVDMIHMDIIYIYIILDETMYHNPDFTTSRRWHLCLERKPIMTSRVFENWHVSKDHSSKAIYYLKQEAL